MAAYNMKCPVCGKLFYVGDRGSYVYKHVMYSYKGGVFTGYNSTGYFCSWSCFRKMEKKNFVYEVKDNGKI